MTRPRWIRVRDPLTRHEFDRRDDDPAVKRGRFVPIKPTRYPPSPIPRKAKHYPRSLAGLSASRESRRQPAVAESEEATEGDDDSG